MGMGFKARASHPRHTQLDPSNPPGYHIVKMENLATSLTDTEVRHKITFLEKRPDLR